MGIKGIIKGLGMGTAARLGLPRLVQRLLAPGGLTVLMYHAVVREPLAVADWCFVDEAAFRRQMQYLRKYFEVLALADAVARLKKDSQAGSTKGSKDGSRNSHRRRPAAVITFDDGYQNNYDVAFPILREAGMPATIFLTTGLVGTDETVWFCRLNHALAATRASALEWGDQIFTLADPSARARASARIQARLKELPHAQLTCELDRILAALGAAPVDSPISPLASGSPYRLLDPQSIRSMQASGLIEFGAHTHRHAILSGLTPSEQLEEIRRSVREVEALTGRPCRFFAYPNGRRRDYDAASLAALRSLGIEAAVTTEEDLVDRCTPPLEIGRVGVGADLSMANFEFLAYQALRLARLACRGKRR